MRSSMMRKSLFEKELVAEMETNLIKRSQNKNFDHLEEAADFLNQAAEIFEDLGMIKSADRIVSLLSKIAQNEKPNLEDQEIEEDQLSVSDGQNYQLEDFEDESDN